MCRMLSHFVGGGNTLNKAIGHSEKPECQMWKLLWLKPTSFLPVTLTLHFKRPTSLPSQCQTSHLSRAQCGDKRALEKVCSLFLWVGRSCCGRCCCLIVPVKLIMPFQTLKSSGWHNSFTHSTNIYRPPNTCRDLPLIGSRDTEVKRQMDSGMLGAHVLVKTEGQ